MQGTPTWLQLLFQEGGTDGDAALLSDERVMATLLPDADTDVIVELVISTRKPCLAFLYRLD